MEINKYFNNKEFEEKMINGLHNDLEKERTLEEIKDFFSSKICTEMNEENIVIAWKKYKETKKCII